MDGIVVTWGSFVLQVLVPTVGTVLAIDIAVIPERVRLSKKARILVGVSPLISGLAYMMLTAFALFSDSGSWADKPFGEELDSPVVVIVLLCLALTLINTAVVYFFKGWFTDKRLSKKYVKMTEEHNLRAPLLIFGGDFGFLGTPARCDEYHEGPCTMKGRQFFAKRIRGMPCRTCCKCNPQWTKMVSLLGAGCHVHIVCDGERMKGNESARILMGYLLGNYPDLFKLSFYGCGEQIQNMRGRRVIPNEGSPTMRLTFKKGGEENSYNAPFLFYGDENVGKLVTEALDQIVKRAKEVEDEDKKAFIDRAQGEERRL